MSLHRPKKPSPLPRCAWTANGWTCRYRAAEVSVNGARVRCRFCSGHQCAKSEGGLPCGVATVAGFRYCQNHSRCTAVGEGGRCANYIKGMDPTKYKYCAQLHNCSTEDCDAQRATHPDTDADLRYCPAHRCPHPTCRRQKISQGPHCATHTCSGPDCAAFCDGGGGPGSATRYCDRHRPCGTEGCARLCHTRENGVPAPHCGLHYCRADGCERERRGDETCAAHACVEQGCGRRRDDEVEGAFCRGHECKAAGCFFRRRRGDWCAEHVCATRGCEGEAGLSGYCDRHQLCLVVGCERYRAITGDRIHERCEKPAPCASPGCPRPAVPTHLFCTPHLCAGPSCPQPATPPLTLCTAHKCALPHCAAARLEQAPFCAAHACHRSPPCGDRAEAETQQRCGEHARCRVEGCGRFRAGEGCCEEQRRGEVGCSGQWAHWGVAM